MRQFRSPVVRHLLEKSALVLTHAIPGPRARNLERIVSYLQNLGDDAGALRVLQRATVRGPMDERLAVIRDTAFLRSGGSPQRLEASVAALLRRVDAEVALGQHDDAGADLALALGLLFHPILQMGSEPSQVMEDPEGLLDVLGSSHLVRRLQARAPKRTRKGFLGERVLFLTYGAPTFVNELRRGLGGSRGMETRFLDLSEDPAHRTMLEVKRLTQARLRHLETGVPLSPPEELGALLAWADVVFVEWGHRLALWASMLELRSRLVVRLHAYEVRTELPQLIAWENVDDLVMVFPPLRDALLASAPGVARAGRIAIHANATVLAPFRREKLPGAHRTIGLIGWNRVVKDPLWALQVLRELRQHDPSWRMLLVGDTQFIETGAGDGEYRLRLERELAGLGPAVEQTGFTTDVPEVLRRVGVIMSSSLSESAHQGLVEGVASGALPVTRNWPHQSRWGGPGVVYPESWVVESVADAVARIESADDATAAEAQRWVFENRDWSVVGPALAATILGGEDAQAL